MQCNVRTVTLGMVSLLLAVVCPLALWADVQAQVIDFRERSTYTTEELVRSLLIERGIGPMAGPMAGPKRVALNVYFAPNSDKILKDYYADLQKLGEALSQLARSRFQIAG